MQEKKIYFLCDGKKCGENHGCGRCRHTADITHAVNFKINVKHYFELESTSIFQRIYNRLRNKANRSLKNLP